MSLIRKEKIKIKKITTLEMEGTLAKFLNYRSNLIVPNVFWSFFRHELDLCVLSKSGYCTEVEIKISKADLIKDKEKKHGHIDSKIKYLYFAIPRYLMSEIEHIPERAGIIEVFQSNYDDSGWWARIVRGPEQNPSKYKFSEADRVELMRLLCMRIWKLKRDLSKLKK